MVMTCEEFLYCRTNMVPVIIPFCVCLFQSQLERKEGNKLGSKPKLDIQVLCSSATGPNSLFLQVLVKKYIYGTGIFIVHEFNQLYYLSRCGRLEPPPPSSLSTRRRYFPRRTRQPRWISAHDSAFRSAQRFVR